MLIGIYSCIGVSSFVGAILLGVSVASPPSITMRIIPSVALGHIPLCDASFSCFSAGFLIDGKEFLFQIFKGEIFTTIAFQIVELHSGIVLGTL
jgi:hypothetical protein